MGEVNPLIPFTVIINIGKAIVGAKNYIFPIYPFIFQVDSVTVTNVSGILGELVYNLGIGSAYIYTTFINFNGLFLVISGLYFIFKISSICGINSSILHLTLNISNAELI